MQPLTQVTQPDTLKTLPGDDIRQVLWRMEDRYDLAMLVQSVRAVARGPVARVTVFLAIMVLVAADRNAQ
ncbi:MAG TPA: hypothetical protein PLF84_23950, partial [Bryobacteraceae bacterium]|nr:hypothetical protein [Bryobacteraceae bacterium]